MATTDQPLVSVVMVIRNVERFLPEAIESVLNQTLRNFEFIIIDFGSTDKSKDIAASYATKDSRISLRDIPKCGLAAARNGACFLAKGRYIAIQDADDISLPNRLMEEVNFLEKHPEVGLVGSAIQRIDADGKYLATVNFYPTEDQEIRLKLKEWNTFWQPTVLMLREAFVHTGGYREILPQSEDYDLWLRISEHYKCANLAQILVNYRIHPYQVSVRRRKEQILCTLAAQAAASLRQEGKADPLNSVKSLTTAVLAGMGVSEARQKASLAEGYSYWIKQLYAAGECAAAIQAAAEMLQVCEEEGVEPRFISDVHLTVAKAYWKQGRMLPCFLFMSRAVLARPRIIGRPLKPLLRLTRVCLEAVAYPWTKL